jgi:hypothetical protein
MFELGSLAAQLFKLYRAHCRDVSPKELGRALASDFAEITSEATITKSDTSLARAVMPISSPGKAKYNS